ncbi:MAG: NAD(P)/FAD-dependent oxidoreductase [Gemmatimonadaceae bacterium]
MIQQCEIAIIGSGFAGSLMARVLAALGYDVALLERGTHPRFAIGESSTPLANLSMERLARRYGLADCYRLATHGRWLEHFPDLRRGLKRGFTFYRHHPDQAFANRGFDSERLLVAASPSVAAADTHWLRADVDHHFVREAIAAGVDYRDRVELTGADVASGGVRLTGQRDGASFDLHAGFVIDASGPGGFLARQLSIPSGLERTRTRSALVFSHFSDVRTMSEVAAGLPEGPYPDDWAAVHHLIDEGWMYSLRFDHGVTSAGFALTPRGLAELGVSGTVDAEALWCALLARYPTLAGAFADAKPLMPLAFRRGIQHRLTSAAGDRWALLPHAYAFVDPLFSTGIAWSLRAIERLALCFEPDSRGRRVPKAQELTRYDALLGAEADHIDRLVAGAYDAMAHFDLFAAHVMIYFATVSFAEVRQRLIPDDFAAWNGFLGVSDPVSEPLARESVRRLRRITGGRGISGIADERRRYAEWVTAAIAPRNVVGLAEPARHHLYPVDLDVLIGRHELLGMNRDQMLDALPALRGMALEPSFPSPNPAGRSPSPLAFRSKGPAHRGNSW